MSTEPGNSFDPLTPPRAPEHLRAGVLAAARRALESAPPRPSIWERIGSSRPLQLGWALAMLALLGAHTLLALRPLGGDGYRPVAIAAELAHDPAGLVLRPVRPLPRFD